MILDFGKFQNQSNRGIYLLSLLTELYLMILTLCLMLSRVQRIQVSACPLVAWSLLEIYSMEDLYYESWCKLNIFFFFYVGIWL